MLKMLTRKFTNAAPAEAMFYDKQVHSSIRIADLKTGDILPIKINTEGMGSFHFGNSYEIEGAIYFIFKYFEYFCFLKLTEAFSVSGMLVRITKHKALLICSTLRLFVHAQLLISTKR